MSNKTAWTAIVRAGTGVDVDSDFTRLMVDTPIEIESINGIHVYGTIPGDMSSRLGFMRRARVRIHTQTRFISDEPRLPVSK